MKLLISNSSDKPIYEQICIRIKSLIMNGTLSAGGALPSMRVLAAYYTKLLTRRLAPSVFLECMVENKTYCIIFI